MDYSPWSHKKSDTTEQLIPSLSFVWLHWVLVDHAGYSLHHGGVSMAGHTLSSCGVWALQLQCVGLGVPWPVES